MSKSLNNYIAFTDIPREMFGKIMSIPDELIVPYLKYGAWAEDSEVKAVESLECTFGSVRRESQVSHLSLFSCFDKCFDCTAGCESLFDLIGGSDVMHLVEIEVIGFQ